MENKIKNVLSPESEDVELLDSSAVTAEMKRQWDSAAEKDDDRMLHIGERAKRSVLRQISGRHLNSLRNWRRYGVAASIALILTLGAGVAMYGVMLPGWNTDYYVFHTGNQGRETITLSDGTTVTLGAESKIVYPERFTGRERRVEIEGQAYFSVAKDDKRSFVVAMRDLDVVVLGTAFEVFENERGPYTEVILTEGRARVDYQSGNNKESYTMHPDQKLVYSNGSVKVTLEDAALYTGWKDNDGLTFVREHLSNILPRLEKWYGCTIECTSPEMLEETFTFKVRNESPEVLFRNMSLTLDMEYTIDRVNNVYTIGKPR